MIQCVKRAVTLTSQFVCGTNETNFFCDESLFNPSTLKGKLIHQKKKKSKLMTCILTICGFFKHPYVSLKC